MAQHTTLKARGLFTFPNNLSELPEGALTTANNVVIDREGVISPRRGFDVYGDAFTGLPGLRAKQLLSYKDRVLRHYSTRLEFDSDGEGTFSVLNNSDAVPASVTETASGIRIKSIESNGNLYLTTSTGIRKLSAVDAAGLTGAVLVDAGGVKALDGQAVLNPSPGFFTQDSVVAYRILWGNKDANSNLILGSPSERIVISNSLNESLVSDYNTLVQSLAAAAATPGADALSDTDYASLVVSSATGAANLHTALKFLCEKLDTDLGVTTYYNGGLAPSIYFDYITAPVDPATAAELVTLQNFYNAIVDALILEPIAKISLDAQGAGNFQNSAQSATVDLTFTVPQGVDTNYLYQVYRTALVSATGPTLLSDLDPGDEMQLVFEGNPTDDEINVDGEITVTDITPDSFRGANLYTNANSGEGIAQANEVPPLAKDIALFRNSTFYANTQTKHRKTLSLLGVTGLTNQTLTIGLVGGSSLTYTFVDTVKTTLVTNVAGSLLSAGAADYFDIYSAGDQIHYRVWFDVGGVSTPPAGGAGITLHEVDVESTDTAPQVATKLAAALDLLDEFVAESATNVTTIVNSLTGVSSAPTENVGAVGFAISVPAGKTGAGEDVGARNVGVGNDATPAQAVDSTARSLVRIINKQAAGAIYAYYLSGPADVPGTILLESRTLGTAAFYLTVGHASISSKFNPTLPTSGQNEKSDNEVMPNRIYFSKFQQPEAVPLVNYIDVGPRDKRIMRIIPLRDSLFVLKEDGTYRLSGEAGNFTVTLFDNSTNCKAGDSAAVLNNKIYMLSDQGVATVSDGGVEIISRSIENLLATLSLNPNFTSATFGVGYESDRAYMLWSVKKLTDTSATQCFRYNVFTQTWTTLTLAKTCAVVNSPEDVLYLGADDTNYIEKERKSFTRLDYADRSTTLSITPGSVQDAVLSIGGVFGVEPGDVLTQTQYVTISQLNRLLKKLDIDTGVTDTDYYATCGVVMGDDISSKLVLLAAKLNADAGVAEIGYTATSTTDFVVNQTDFNGIVTKLNLNSNVRFNNYRESAGTVTWEIPVEAIDKFTNRITLSQAIPLIVGEAVSFKHIDSEITWAPHHFGDPSVTKHVRETTILFENQAFTQGTASFDTDLITGFVDVPVIGEGTGTFGSAIFGRATWGGDGSGRPFRTYVPREKARCRYINLRFEHASAFEKYAIFGVSFTYEGTSSRGYR